MIYIKAPAKINLSLDVISKRDDGYHNIKTLMMMTSLGDDMRFSLADKVDIKPQFDFPLEENLIFKAYLKLKEYVNKDLPFEVVIDKKIPIAAGLAGGTSNGAAVFYGLNDLYDLKLDKKILTNLAKSLGADFTYMMTGGVCIASGVGDQLEMLDDIKLQNVLLVNPGIQISTPYVYNNIKIKDDRINFTEVYKGLKDIDIERLNRYMGNSMEEVVFKDYSLIKNIKDKMRSFDAASLMSGSGSTVFGIFQNDKDLKLAFDIFKEQYNLCYKVEAGGEHGSFWHRTRYCVFVWK